MVEEAASAGGVARMVAMLGLEVLMPERRRTTPSRGQGLAIPNSGGRIARRLGRHSMTFYQSDWAAGCGGALLLEHHLVCSFGQVL